MASLILRWKGVDALGPGRHSTHRSAARIDIGDRPTGCSRTIVAARLCGILHSMLRRLAARGELARGELGRGDLTRGVLARGVLASGILASGKLGRNERYDQETAPVA